MHLFCQHLEVEAARSGFKASLSSTVSARALQPVTVLADRRGAHCSTADHFIFLGGPRDYSVGNVAICHTGMRAHMKKCDSAYL